jgi:hypothetical protein
MNFKYIVPMLALGLSFFVTDVNAAPKKTRGDVGQILFKIHDVVPEKNSEGVVMYCNVGVTFFNRTKSDLNNMAISMVWNDDVISEVIDSEKQVEREAKRNRSNEPRPRYSTANFTSNIISVDLKLPPVKVNQQITLKTKVDTDRCFVLLNDMDLSVLNCGSMGISSSKENCANYFQYVSPKQPEYHTEFKEISWENRLLQEDEAVSRLQEEVNNLYDETMGVLNSITNDFVLEENNEINTVDNK